MQQLPHFLLVSHLRIGLEDHNNIDKNRQSRESLIKLIRNIPCWDRLVNVDP